MPKCELSITAVASNATETCAVVSRSESRLSLRHQGLNQQQSSVQSVNVR